VVVREDGMAREVLRVTPATEPMQLALLVDNSAAATSAITDLRRGLEAFVTTLGNKHELSLVTYADRPTLVVSFSKNGEEVVKGIERLFAQPGSGGYLIDAVKETAQGFLKREAPRPVIVVVGTDGIEFSNTHYDVALDLLREAGVQLHVLLITGGGGDRTMEERYRSILIDRGTRETGGRREDLLASTAVPGALESLAAELTSQFRVVYSRPDSLIPPRDVQVSSAVPDLRVRGVLLPAKR
jgi:hypothetical protein